MNTARRTGVLVLLAGMTLGLGVGWGLRGLKTAPSSEAFHTGITLERVQKLASLLTTRVTVADIQESVIGGRTGGVRAVLLVKGDFLVSVDLLQARLEAVDSSHQTVTLSLPMPRVISPRVDHARTRIYAIQASGLWKLIGSGAEEREVVDQAFRQAQESIAAVGQQPSVVEDSRQHAEEVLTSFFQALGYRVEIQWQR